MFGTFDPVVPLSEAVFSALELLMSDCVLATEPSTSAILVTNNLFRYKSMNFFISLGPANSISTTNYNCSMNCGALARGVVFKDFEIQVVTEESAEQIQVRG